TPGILVRQPYTDADIGHPKAKALARRLNGIRADAPVFPIANSAQAVFRDDIAAATDSDLVIDATADASVASLLELLRSRNRGVWPATLSVLIGQSARKGIVCVAQQDATGCGRDILRRLALDARGFQNGDLGDIAIEIF